MNKLLVEHNSCYHSSVGQKCIQADYSVVSEEFQASDKSLKFKVSDEIRIIKYKIIFSKGYTKNGQKKYLMFKHRKNNMEHLRKSIIVE